MTDPMDAMPADHGSDRYGMIAITAPDGIDPPQALLEKTLADPCEDCNPNQFLKYLGGDPTDVGSWEWTVAHDESCPGWLELFERGEAT